MSRLTIAVETDFNYLGQVGRGFRRVAKTAIRTYLRAVVAQCEVISPRKTGAYAKGFYVKTSNYSTYNNAASNVRELNPDARIQPELQSIEDELTGEIGHAAGYGLFVHQGTIRNEGHYTIPMAMLNIGDEFYANEIRQGLKQNLRSKGSYDETLEENTSTYLYDGLNPGDAGDESDYEDSGGNW